MFPCAFQSRLLSSFSVCDSPAEAGRTASVSAAGVRLSVQTCACDSRSRGGTFGRGDLDSLGTTAVASVGVCSSQKHHPRGFGPFTHTRGVTPVLTQYANEARETSHPALRPAKRTFFDRRQSSLTGFAYGKHSLPSARPLGSVGDRAAGREALSSRVSSCVSVNALVRLDPRGKAAGGEGTPLKARGDFLFVGC